MSGPWQVVLRAEELAQGRMQRVEIGDCEVLIANVNGEVLAIEDRCTHEDLPLSGGVLEADRVRCPLHGSWFCLRTGQPLEEPADEPVRCYRARVRDGNIEIAID